MKETIGEYRDQKSVQQVGNLSFHRAYMYIYTHYIYLLCYIFIFCIYLLCYILYAIYAFLYKKKTLYLLAKINIFITSIYTEIETAKKISI